MSTDDEVVFGHVVDDTRSCYELLEPAALAGAELTAELALTAAEFELHGGTLESFLRWYPSEARVREAFAEWEECKRALSAKGLSIEA